MFTFPPLLRFFLYIKVRLKTPVLKPQPGVGQNKLPNWAKCSCQKHAWLIRSETSAANFANHVSQFLLGEDALLIVEIQEGRGTKSWKNLLRTGDEIAGI